MSPLQTALKLSKVLKPMKVIFLNNHGGLVDQYGKVCAYACRYLQHLLFVQLLLCSG